MARLLYKDIYLSRAVLIVFGVMDLLLLTVSVIINGSGGGEPSENAMVALACMLGAFYLSNVMNSEFFAKDQRKTWLSFAVSTPGAAKMQVQSKYLLLLLKNMAILFACFAADAIAVGISGNQEVSVLMLAAILFSLELILNAIEVPFLLRFGAEKGLTFQSIVVMAVICVCGIYGLYGDLSFFGDNPFNAIMEFLKSKKMAWVLAAIPYIAIGGYYLSYRISLKAYRKGAEYFEQ